MEEGEVWIVIDSAFSVEEILLAYTLSQEAMEKGKNIANDERIEFLLWLAGTRQIDKAKELTKPKKGKIKIIKKGRDISIKGAIREKATWKEIERISLSRILSRT